MTENKMTDREKLIELIAKAKRTMWCKKDLSCELTRNGYIAEYLLSHGVTFEKQGEWILKEDFWNTHITIVMLAVNHSAFTREHPKNTYINTAPTAELR